MKPTIVVGYIKRTDDLQYRIKWSLHFHAFKTSDILLPITILITSVTRNALNRIV